MKATELMIGDWVTLSKGNWSENRQVELIDIEMIAESVYLAEPIPLTPEILEKNDFLYYSVDDGYYGYFEESYSNQTTEIILFNVNNENRNVQIHINYHNDETILHLMECNYVHQLQHILKVCGIKKEIEL